MKLILVGRSGSGKTSVMESLLGYTPPSKSPTDTVTRYGSPLTIADSLGFFSISHDQQVCTMKLSECVYLLTPGPDAFGLVICIGRFTAEERKMIDIFRETFGEEVLRFTILIFTRLDDLLYDNVSLDEYLADCTPELRDIISLCGGRYIGFDNTGSWESRTRYGQSLVSMIKTLQLKNNSIYTVDMLEKATTLKMKKEEDEMKWKEDSHRQMKEEMKASMRQELQDQMRKDIEEKLSREERKRNMMVQTYPKKESHTMNQYDQQMSLQIAAKYEKSQRQLMYSSPTNQFKLPKDKVEQKTGDDIKLILVGRSGSGKTSVMESLMGSPLPSENQIHRVTRLGSPLTIAETFGFFSRTHDLESCRMKLAESVYSFHPGPDVFGLVIRIGRYTEEETKMVDLFRETLGEDVFRFTILIFTRLDDLTYDNIPLDDFLVNSTAEMKELLALCGGRYIGFDNIGSSGERMKYSQSLVSMAKTLQMKNSGVYTVDMLEKAMVIKMKKEEEEMKCKEESHRQLKEEMKASMRLELQKEMRKDIEKKLSREERERKMLAQTLPQNVTHLTREEVVQTHPMKEIHLMKEIHHIREERERSMMTQSCPGKVYFTEGESKQQPPRLHPDTGDKRRKQIIYSKPKEHMDVPRNKTEQSPVKGSPKKEGKKARSSSQKPALKPKPKLGKKQTEQLATQEVDEASPTPSHTPEPEERAAARPRRSGFMGSIISFFESFGS